MDNPLMKSVSIYIITLALVTASTTAYAQSMEMQGVVLNVTVGKQDSMKFVVNKIGSEVYSVLGSFNNVRLFGKFEGSGRSISQCAEKHECLLFMGVIDVSGPNGGWPVGTKTTFTMSVDIQPDGKSAYGVYTIGPLSSFDFVQYGIMDMRVKSQQ